MGLFYKHEQGNHVHLPSAVGYYCASLLVGVGWIDVSVDNTQC